MNLKIADRNDMDNKIQDRATQTKLILDNFLERQAYDRGYDDFFDQVGKYNHYHNIYTIGSNAYHAYVNGWWHGHAIKNYK
jgi:hypothetical protein